MKVVTALLIAPVVGAWVNGNSSAISEESSQSELSEYYSDYFGSARVSWSNTWGGKPDVTFTSSTTSTPTTTTTSTTTSTILIETTTTSTTVTTTASTKSVSNTSAIVKVETAAWEDPDKSKTTWPAPESNETTTVPIDNAGEDQLVILISITVSVSVVVLAVGSVVVYKLTLLNSKKRKNPDETEMTILPPDDQNVEDNGSNNGINEVKPEVKVESVVNPGHKSGTKPTYFRPAAPEEGVNLTQRVPDQNATDPGKVVPISEVANRQKLKKKSNKTAPVGQLVNVTVHELEPGKMAKKNKKKWLRNINTHNSEQTGNSNYFSANQGESTVPKGK